MRRVSTVLGGAALVVASVVAGALSTASGSAHSEAPFPSVIALPDGFAPEGIATGRGTSFYVGSLADGAVYRGDVRTSEGEVLVAGTPGSVAVGTEVDHRDRLFVAGGPTGTGRVYDAGSGELLAEYSFAPPNTGFVNDVTVTRDAAYFTDSVNQQLYVVTIGPGGTLAEAATLPLTGDIDFEDGFNANGIAASPNGRTLLVVQSNTGLLFRVDAATGRTHEVDLGGASLTNGDGLLLQGLTLHVVRNQLDEIAVVELDRHYRSGEVTDTVTDSHFDVPTTVAGFGSSLYAVNARFGTTPTPDTEYTVVRVDRH